MTYKNFFFKKKSKIKFNEILNILKINDIKKNNLIINDIKELDFASKNDITFFNSSKYIDLVRKTKSKFVITNKKLQNLIPKKKKI